MTLITAVLNRVARECSVDAPSQWITATDEDHVAIRDDFLIETVDDILNRGDPAAPFGAQIAVTGADSYVSGSGYALPSDFRRLQRGEMAVYETTPSRRVCTPVIGDGEWTHVQEVGLAGVTRFYQINGYPENWYIDFYQTLANTSDSVTVSYVTNNWMISSGGTKGSAFTDAGDILLMPRMLVETGMVYRFRERNGLPFEQVYARHQMHLARFLNDGRTRRKIRFGPNAILREPWDVPVPDYIPDS